MRTNILLEEILLASLVVSCNSSGVIEESSIKLQKPEESAFFMPDADFPSLTNVLNPVSLRLCRDTILIVQGQINDENKFHFSAFSTVTANNLASFAPKGRGPGEMVSPHVEPSFSNDDSLMIEDNGAGVAYVVDIDEAIKSESLLDCADVVSMPSGSINSVTLGDSLDFIVQVDGDELLYRVLSKDGSVIRTYRPYKNVKSKNGITQLSGIILSNGNEGVVAEVMLFLPQINFYNVFSDQIHSTAVDRKCYEWESVTKEMIGPGTIQFYQNATASPEYIFAIYDNVSLENMIKGGYSSSIHVFDWQGNFLYEFNVNESLSDIAFDANKKYLYAIDRQSGNIIRYNMCKYL